MSRDEVVDYIERLGFMKYSVSDVGSNTNETYIFDENLEIVLEKKVDYYTSWYGNHPITYKVLFRWFRSNLKTFTLDSITPFDICDVTARMMEVYHNNIKSGNVMYMDRVLKFERANNELLKVIRRDLKIHLVLLSEIEAERKEDTNGVK